MVELRQITKENYEECISSNVSEIQKDFVSSNVHSLAQAWLYYEAEGYYTLRKLMIDERYKNKGYGKKALRLGIDYLVNRFKVTEIYTAYYAPNRIARELYASVGFRETGEVIGNEIGMKLIVNNGNAEKLAEMQ